MTELPEEVARELDELFGHSNVPNDAVTLQQLSDSRGGTTNTWRKRLQPLIKEGKWERGRRASGQQYWYWPVKDEQRE